MKKENFDYFENLPHNQDNPNPWQALYYDESIPIAKEAKVALLLDNRSVSRQFFLPFIRPFARLTIVSIQILKIFLPKNFTSSVLLHRFLAWGLKTWVNPHANLLILRHIRVGTEILEFLGANIKGVEINLPTLKPHNINDVKDHLFLKHDLNLYNFVILLNKQLKEKNIEFEPKESLNFDMIHEGNFDLEPFPDKWTNCLDLQSALEIFTPVYQLFLTDSEFWRASNSLQLDETIGIYAAKVLKQPEILSLVNNKHPLVHQSTLKTAWRLMLHGLAAESLHKALLDMKLKKKNRVI